MKSDKAYFFGAGVCVGATIIQHFLTLNFQEATFVFCVGLGGCLVCAASIVYDFLLEFKERKAHRERIMIDEPQQPIGAYGKSFHSMNIKQMIDGFHNLCPRCQSHHWQKEGSEYLNRGRKVQLWKCGSCDYEEERFA